MKKYFYFIMIFLYQPLFPQVSMVDMINNTVINTDSIFEYFVKPEIPMGLIDSQSDDYYCYEFNIFCYFKTDTNNKIIDFYRYPLYKFHNNFSDTSIVWEQILNSLDSVRNLWVVKPIDHVIKEKYPQELKHYLTNINNGNTSAFKRPFLGLQTHCLVLNLFLKRNFTSREPFEPLLLYWVNIDY